MQTQLNSERGIFMKKLFVILLALGLFLIPAALAEEISTYAGVWYAEQNGMPIQMNLQEGGTYTLLFPGADPIDGTWEEQTGYICLDGVQPPELMVLGENLKWSGTMLFFTQESVETYIPADVIAEAPEGILNGYWQCVFVNRNGTVFPALAVQDRTDLYVEGTSAVLGGPVLGDVLVRMTAENGALAGEAEAGAVRIEMQQDELLRLTITGSDGSPQVWYLIRTYSPLIDEPLTGNAAP